MPGVELVKDFHPIPKVVVDREQLQSVVTNLLLNARDAIGSAGRILIETGQRNGRAVLSVRDDGCGMSSDFLRDSLFRPFQTTKKMGLGIGMFQSKMIVEAHQGSIQVESEPGKGTKFGVYLPFNGGQLRREIEGSCSTGNPPFARATMPDRLLMKDVKVWPVGAYISLSVLHISTLPILQ